MRRLVLVWPAEYHAGRSTVESIFIYNEIRSSSVTKILRPLQGGIYFFQLIDHYAASRSIMFLAFFEVIAISWLYGVRRLCNNVKEMTGRLPSIYFRFCWFLAAPFLIMVCFLMRSLSLRNFRNVHNQMYANKAGWLKIADCVNGDAIIERNFAVKNERLSIYCYFLRVQSTMFL